MKLKRKMDSIHRPIASYAAPKSITRPPSYSYFHLPRATATTKPVSATSATHTQHPLTSTSSTITVNKNKCVLPYAGVDLRKLPWDKVIEIMEKQAEVYKLYQINASCGYEWANQQNRDYIEAFNAQFKIEMERCKDYKLLPSFITKCIAANEFFQKTGNNSTNTRVTQIPATVTASTSTSTVPTKERLNKENTPPRKRKRSEPIKFNYAKGTEELKLLLQKERRVSHLDPPVFRYPSPSTSLLNYHIRNNKTVAPSTSSSVPVVAKFKIERYRDNNNCEFFDLTADTDTDENKSQAETSLKISTI